VPAAPAANQDLHFLILLRSFASNYCPFMSISFKFYIFEDPCLFEYHDGIIWKALESYSHYIDIYYYILLYIDIIIIINIDYSSLILHPPSPSCPIS
jgi:hypothetical protein